MNKYELTLVFPEEQDGKNKKSVMKMVEDFVAKNKGKVITQESWGIKELAFPIKKHERADYEHYAFELDPKHQQTLENNVRLEENILRFLFIRV